MLDNLGRACRQARLDADLRQIDISTTAGTTHATISRFETGRSWPLNADSVVAAYAAECRIRPLDLWRQALEDWIANTSE